MSYMDLMLGSAEDARSSTPPSGTSVLSDATPADLKRIATDPSYPADPAMREEAKALLERKSASGIASPSGIVAEGNIDLTKRPVVKNPDGTISTVRSMSFNDGQAEVLVPTVSDDGRIMSDDEAIDAYRRTGRHLGKFDTPENATAYAQHLHEDQAEMYGGRDAEPTKPEAGAPPEPEPQRLLKEKIAEKRRGYSYMDLMLDKSPSGSNEPASVPLPPPPKPEREVRPEGPGDMFGARAGEAPSADVFAHSNLTDDDRRSPIPNQLISDGKKIIAASDSSKAASLSDIALASFANDPEARLRYYAKQRGIPESRYRIVDGEVAYQDDDGKWYREKPEALLRDPKTLVQGLANQVGPALTAVPPAAAGIVTAPLLLTGPAGLATSMGATALAGSVSQGAREFIANKVTGQEMSGGRVIQEGATAALGQGIGAGMTAWAGRNVASDISKLDRPAAEALAKKGEDRGITLTPAETTNLPSLKGQQKALGNLTESGDHMDEFYKERAGKIRTAVDDTLNAISPQDSGEVAGKNIRTAAGKAVDQAKEARSKVADPLYAAARKNGAEVDVNPILASIDDQLEVAKGGIKTALQNARSLLMREVEEAAPDGTMVKRSVPDTRIAALHEAKLAIDDMIDGAAQSGLGNTAKAKLKSVQSQLLDAMDEASPDYKAARETFRDASPAVNALEDGIIGVIKNLKDPNLQTAAQKLFDPKTSGPKAVSEARDALEKADPEAWQAIKRAWLQQNWEQAGKESMASGTDVVNQGPKFRNLIMGDAKRRLMLERALTPEEMRGLNDLAEVLEAAGRVKPLGSDTAWNQEMMKVARDEAKPAWAKAAEIVGTPQRWGKMVGEWATERALRNKAAEVAKIITEPEALKELRQLRFVSPTGAKFRAGFAHIITRFGEGGVDAALD